MFEVAFTLNVNEFPAQILAGAVGCVAIVGGFVKVIVLVRDLELLEQPPGDIASA